MQGQQLDRQRQLQCYRLYQENAYAYASIDFLASTLVENGLVVTRGAANTTPAFQEVVDVHYHKFVKDCLMSAMVYGFIAWDTQMVDRSLVPVVLPGTHIMVDAVQEKGLLLPVYTARYTVTGERARFFSMLYPPDLVHMVVDSPLCKVLPYHIFEVSLLQNAARADRRNADTPLVLENTATQNGFWALNGLTDRQDELLNTHRGVTSAAAASFEDMSSAVGCELESRMHCVDETLVRLQENHVQNLNTVGELDALQQSKLYKKTTQSTLPRMQLPPHTRVQGVSFPTTRSDLKELLRMNAQRICIALGVPPEMLIKDHHVKLDQTQSLRAVAQRISELRKILQPILTQALLECTKGDDLVLGLLTGDTRYTVLPKIEIPPQLPPTEELITLYQQQLLPPAFLQEHIAKKYGFDVSAYAAAAEPPDAKRAKHDGHGSAPSAGRAHAAPAGASKEQ